MTKKMRVNSERLPSRLKLKLLRRNAVSLASLLSAKGGAKPRMPNRRWRRGVVEVEVSSSEGGCAHSRRYDGEGDDADATRPQPA